MPEATILVPTHSRVESLREAIGSAQEQTLGDFELFVVGDGVGDACRDAVRELTAADSRIRLLDFPKAPRMGERNRHEALGKAQGRFVAYLGDDDVWLPEHLETLSTLLRDVDFGHTLHVAVGPDGELRFLAADLENPAFRRLLLLRFFNRFDFSFAGHTLAAYRRLPHGWRTTPPNFPWTDLYMWRQFLEQPWCTARSLAVPTAICTWTFARPHVSDEDRASELAALRARFGEPGFRDRLQREALQALARHAARRDVETKTSGGIARSAWRLSKAAVFRRALS